MRRSERVRVPLWEVPGLEDDGLADSLLLQQVETVYQRAVTSKEPQSIVLTGRSGSGKTDNFKRALEYLVESSPHRTDSCFSGN